MHFSRLIILVGAAGALFALFFPMLDAGVIGGINGFSGAAWPALLFLAVPVALAIIGDHAEGFDRPVALIAIGLSGIAVIFVAQKFIDASLAARAARSAGESGTIGVGMWMLVVAVVVVLAGSVASLSRRVR